MIHKAYNRIRIGALVAVLSAATTMCASAQPASQVASGSISGNIYGPDGKALGGTTVWANIVSPLARPVDGKSSVIPVLNAITANDGSFALSNVPAGDYVLCASNPAVAALNPCGWGGAPRIKMANGVPVAGETIHMAAAGILQVSVNDPGGLLAANAHKPGAGLGLGLATPRGFVSLPVAGSTGTSRSYKLPVPFNTTYTLMISTTYFKLATAAGIPISAAGYTMPVTIPSGRPAEVISLQVVGTGN